LNIAERIGIVVFISAERGGVELNSCRELVG